MLTSDLIRERQVRFSIIRDLLHSRLKMKSEELERKMLALEDSSERSGQMMIDDELNDDGFEILDTVCGLRDF